MRAARRGSHSKPTDHAEGAIGPAYFTASRKKLITLPSTAKPAPSASATVAPLWPASAKHAAASAAPVVCPVRRGGDDARGAAAAVRRRASHDRLHVRRLEEPEPHAADHDPPDDIGNARARRKQREQRHAEAKQDKADAAQQADRMAIGEAAGDRRHDTHHQRPRRHEEAGLDLRAPEHVLEIERQRDEGEALHGEGADGGRRRQREHRPAEEVDRQHRRGMIGVTPRQDKAERERRDQLDGHDYRRQIMRGAADARDEQPEAEGREKRAEEIKAVIGARRLRQHCKADAGRDEAERDVDGEQPRPRTDREDRRRDRRPEGEGGGDHQRVVAEGAPQHPAGIDETHQRGVDAHDAAGAEALQGACDQQAVQRPRDRAEQRGDGKQDQAAEIDALVPDDLAERTKRQQRRHQRDLVDIDHPDRLLRADMQIGGNGRQRDVGDRGVERGHCQRREDRCDRPAALLGWQAIGNGMIGIARSGR